MKKTKQFIAMLLSLSCLVTPTFAGTLSVNGKKVTQEQITHSGKLYVPLRVIGEMLGAQVNYDSSTGNTDLVPVSTQVDMNYYAEAILTARYAELLNVDITSLIENLNMLKYEVALAKHGEQLKGYNLVDAYNTGISGIYDRISSLESAYRLMEDMTSKEFAAKYNLLGAYSSLGVDTVEATTRVDKLHIKYDANVAEEALNWIDSALDAAWYIAEKSGEISNYAWNSRLTPIIDPLFK